MSTELIVAISVFCTSITAGSPTSGLEAKRCISDVMKCVDSKRLQGSSSILEKCIRYELK